MAGLQQDMQGFPTSGVPVTQDVRNQVYIGGPPVLRNPINNYTLEVNGTGRFSSTLSGSSTSMNGTQSVATSSSGIAYVPTDGFVNTNTTAATATAPIQRSTRNRLTNTAWNGSASVNQNWITEIMNSGASTVVSRQRWGFMSGTSTNEGYAEMMNVDNSGSLSMLGATYGSESLTNGALTSGTSWTQTGDMALASNAATYTHSTGSGSLSQASGTLSVAGVGNRWYKFVYTASANSGTGTAYIDTTFAANKEYLNLVAGTYTVYFKSATSPGAFTIQITSTSGGVTLDTFSLMECQSGNVTANGLFTGGGTAGIKVTGGGLVGIGTTAPTHTLTLDSTATGVVLYNTSDQTTNYERVRHYWSSNVYTISSDVGGTGTVRPIRIISGNATFGINESTQSLVFTRTTPSTVPTLFDLTTAGTGLSGTSSSQYGMRINPTINQSSTAGYTMLLINPTESATGSGAKLLADFQLGGTTKLNIDNAGIMQYTQNSTGAGSAALGSNSPATTNTAPYTWLKMKSSDGSTVYVPAWK